MTEIPLDYISYLLRLWKSSSESRQSLWYGSLECTQDGKRQEFENIAELVAYLTATYGQENLQEQHSAKS